MQTKYEAIAEFIRDKWGYETITGKKQFLILDHGAIPGDGNVLIADFLSYDDVMDNRLDDFVARMNKHYRKQNPTLLDRVGRQIRRIRDWFDDLPFFVHFTLLWICIYVILQILVRGMLRLFGIAL